MPVQILLICDQQLVREGLYCLLGSVSEFSISESLARPDVLADVASAKPDVIILSSMLDQVSAVECLKQILKADRGAKILVLGPVSERAVCGRWIEAGARGFISLRASSGELVIAVRLLTEGKRYIESDASGGATSEKTLGRKDVVAELNMRQLEVLRLLGEGHSLSTIAEIIGVSYKTVANTCTKIKSKLEVKRTADLIRLAVQLEKS